MFLCFDTGFVLLITFVTAVQICNWAFDMCNKIYLLSYLIVARVSGVMLRFRYSISGICKRESGRNLQKWRMIIMVNGREWTATVMEWHRLLREYVKWAIV